MGTTAYIEATGTNETIVDCPKGINLSPCHCIYDQTFHLSPTLVACNLVSMINVTHVFERIPAMQWPALVLRLTSSDENRTIPADLLGNHTTVGVRFVCPHHGYPLRLNRNAFRSSKQLIEFLYVDECDVGQLNFNFLAGFDKLWVIAFTHTQNNHLANWTIMPPLCNLASLYIRNATRNDLNQWTQFPNLTRGLHDLCLDGNEINDVEIDRILNWTLKTSANSLEYLSLERNNLTKIPRQISLFTKILFVRLDHQKTDIQIITNGSFRIPAHNYIIVSQFSAKNSNISSIQPGAFQGIFSSKFTGLSKLKKK